MVVVVGKVVVVVGVDVVRCRVVVVLLITRSSVVSFRVVVSVGISVVSKWVNEGGTVVVVVVVVFVVVVVERVGVRHRSVGKNDERRGRVIGEVPVQHSARVGLPSETETWRTLEVYRVPPSAKMHIYCILLYTFVIFSLFSCIIIVATVYGE